MHTPDLAPWSADKPPSPAYCGEEERAAVLESYGLDALEDDPELAQITRFVAQLCEAPIALVSLVEEERQRFLAREGLEQRETPRPLSFCAHAMLGAEPMVVPDATRDERFVDNVLVTGHPFIRFYAGAPLISHEGAPLGSLCVIDTVPRPEGLSELQLQGMEVLAAAVMRRLRHRRTNLAQIVERELQADRLRTIAERMPVHVWSADPDGTIEFGNAALYEYCGTDNPDKLNLQSLIHPDDLAEVSAARDGPRSRGERWEVEARVRRHDGEYRWMLMRAWPLQDNQGEIDYWFGAAVDIDDTRRTAEAKDILARELSHRIKNIFAVISGLVSLRSRKVPEAAQFAAGLSDAIRALGRAHDFVQPRSGEHAVTLHGLLEALMAPYHDGDGTRITVSGDDVATGTRAATPIALVFHELATNSAKYGALSNAGGTVRIAVTTEDDTDSDEGRTVRVAWRERGGPAPDRESDEGFGSRLIRMSVEGQLGGTIERHWRDDGVDVDLSVPLASISA